MYSLKTEGLSRWYDAEPHDNKNQMGKERSGSTLSKLEEEDVDEHYQMLTEKHGNTYSLPQKRLWAQTIHCGIHDSHDTPPALPMFGPPPKRNSSRGF